MPENPYRGAVVSVLEVTASERSELLDFQLEALLNSVVGVAVRELAMVFGVPVEKLGQTVYQASLDLDRLEKRRGDWRDPGQVVESPNLAALFRVCQARLGRVNGVARFRRLEATLRRLRTAHELARSRAWIEGFLGPSLTDGQEVVDDALGLLRTRQLRQQLLDFLLAPGAPLSANRLDYWLGGLHA